MENRKILIYITTRLHLLKAIQIVDELGFQPFFFIDPTYRSFKSLPEEVKSRSYILKNNSFFRILFFIIRNRGKFNYILGAEVDAFNFQILLRFLNIGNFYSLDEGVFSVQKTSIYNSMSSFSFRGQKRYLFLNSIFGFPSPPKILMQQSKKHFSWYKKKSFTEIPHLYNKIVQMQPKTYSKSIKKIFISQPWNFMGLSDKSLKRLAHLLVKNNIDTYISHPREDKSYFADKYLHLTSLLVIDTNHPVEEFVNFLSELSDSIEVYTFASGACLELNKRVPVHLFNILDPGEFHESQESLKKILSNRDIKFGVLGPEI